MNKNTHTRISQNTDSHLIKNNNLGDWSPRQKGFVTASYLKMLTHTPGDIKHHCDDIRVLY